MGWRIKPNLFIHYDFTTGKELSHMEALKYIKDDLSFTTHCLEFFNQDVAKPTMLLSWKKIALLWILKINNQKETLDELKNVELKITEGEVNFIARMLDKQIVNLTGIEDLIMSVPEDYKSKVEASFDNLMQYLSENSPAVKF